MTRARESRPPSQSVHRPTNAGIPKTIPGNLDGVRVHLTNNRSISSNSTMADPFEPTSPPPRAGSRSPPESAPNLQPNVTNPTTQSTGLPSNIAAALACIPLVGGLIFGSWRNTTISCAFTRCSRSSLAARGCCFDRYFANCFRNSWSPFRRWAGCSVSPLGHHSALVHLAFLVIMVIAMIKAFSGVALGHSPTSGRWRANTRPNNRCQR